MNIAILHYHFNRGGVTQVVLNHLRALDAVSGDETGLRIALIHGGRREGVTDEQLSGFASIELSTHAVEALDYDEAERAQDERLAGEIRAALAEAGFAADQTLLHVHNHSLGKNISLPGAIRRLAEEGFRLLLQMHDFAEDLRPANYRRLSQALAGGGDPSPALYPQASHIHYAVLNGRDYRMLQQAGATGDRLHLLPNAVGDFGPLPGKDAAREKLHERFGVDRQARYIVYPVRGIRRKNLGEVLLWAAVSPHRTVFAVTLPPLNPVEQTAYRHWTGLAEELRLPCVFETGAPGGLGFLENLSAADSLLTTSIAEGFGMVFLESWLAGRNLLGRDLPEITADFVEAGIRLETLYPQLAVPIDWVGRSELRAALVAAYTHLLGEYGATTISPPAIDKQISTLLASDHVDFAAMNASLQGRVIRHVAADGSARRQLLDLNPKMQTAGDAGAYNSPVAQNADVVRRVYSLPAAGRRLRRLYETVMASPVGAAPAALPAAGHILNAFLNVARLHPIRFED